MNPTEAMEALKPYSRTPPREALEWIRANRNEVEGALLEELDERLKSPFEKARDARFSYALHLCAEMKIEAAFPRYLVLCRLPNVVIDNVLGDILTESMPDMLARTCAGRTEEIQALIEDGTVYEYARGAALQALANLFLDGVITREWLSAYLLSLLNGKLDRRPSAVWSDVIHLSAVLHVEEARPLIEKALQLGLAEEMSQEQDYILGQYERSLEACLSDLRRDRHSVERIEEPMSFFQCHWEEDEDEEEDDDALLKILKNRPPVKLKISAGRNDPCPCGSGRKFKKCCMADPGAKPSGPVDLQGGRIPEKFETASNWMEAGYRHNRVGNLRNAYSCWEACWREISLLLPSTLVDPGEAENTGAFHGYELLDNWLQDFEDMLSYQAKFHFDMARFGEMYFKELLARFPSMDSVMKGNIQVDFASILALLGRHDEATKLLEQMMAEAPDKAQSYVALAGFFGDEAMDYNMKADLPRAIGYLRRALAVADDCEDYDVEYLLEEFNAFQKRLDTPL